MVANTFHIPKESKSIVRILRKTLLEIVGFYVGTVKNGELSCGGTTIFAETGFLLTSDCDTFAKDLQISYQGCPKILFLRDTQKSCILSGHFVTAVRENGSSDEMGKTTQLDHTVTPTPMKDEPVQEQPKALNPTPLMKNDTKPSPSNSIASQLMTASPSFSIESAQVKPSESPSEAAVMGSPLQSPSTKPLKVNPIETMKLAPSVSIKSAAAKPSVEPIVENPEQSPSAKPLKMNLSQGYSVSPIKLKPSQSQIVKTDSSSTGQSSGTSISPSAYFGNQADSSPMVMNSPVSQMATPTASSQGTVQSPSMETGQILRSFVPLPVSTISVSTRPAASATSGTRGLPAGLSQTSNSLQETVSEVSTPPSSAASPLSSPTAIVFVSSAATTQGAIMTKMAPTLEIKASFSSTPSPVHEQNQMTAQAPPLILVAFPFPAQGSESANPRTIMTSIIAPKTKPIDTSNGAPFPKMRDTSPGPSTPSIMPISPSISSSPTSSTSPSPSNMTEKQSVSNGPQTPVPDPGLTCFPARAVVIQADGKSMNIEEVKVGDSVHIGSGKTSRIIAFSHWDANAKTAFIKITTISGRQISLTGTHYLYTSRGLKRADDVHSNDSLQQEDGTWTRVVKTVLVRKRDCITRTPWLGISL